jgi:hypothetical protein
MSRSQQQPPRSQQRAQQQSVQQSYDGCGQQQSQEMPLQQLGQPTWYYNQLQVPPAQMMYQQPLPQQVPQQWAQQWAQQQTYPQQWAQQQTYPQQSQWAPQQEQLQQQQWVQQQALLQQLAQQQPQLPQGDPSQYQGPAVDDAEDVFRQRFDIRQLEYFSRIQPANIFGCISWLFQAAQLLSTSNVPLRHWRRSIAPRCAELSAITGDFSPSWTSIVVNAFLNMGARLQRSLVGFGALSNYHPNSLLIHLLEAVRQPGENSSIARTFVASCQMILRILLIPPRAFDDDPQLADNAARAVQKNAANPQLVEAYIAQVAVQHRWYPHPMAPSRMLGQNRFALVLDVILMLGDFHDAHQQQPLAPPNPAALPIATPGFGQTPLPVHHIAPSLAFPSFSAPAPAAPVAPQGPQYVTMEQLVNLLSSHQQQAQPQSQARGGQGRARFRKGKRANIDRSKPVPGIAPNWCPIHKQFGKHEAKDCTLKPKETVTAGAASGGTNGPGDGKPPPPASSGSPNGQ